MYGYRNQKSMQTKVTLAKKLNQQLPYNPYIDIVIYDSY